jgi:hypothetical protein
MDEIVGKVGGKVPGVGVNVDDHGVVDKDNGRSRNVRRGSSLHPPHQLKTAQEAAGVHLRQEGEAIWQREVPNSDRAQSQASAPQKTVNKPVDFNHGRR